MGAILLWGFTPIFVGFALVIAAGIIGEKYPVLFIPLIILALYVGLKFTMFYDKYIF